MAKTTKIDAIAEPKNQRKREFLREIEREVQQYWADNKVFELDAEEGAETWLGTFPYPYMNGRLHMGHAFTNSKVDFAAGYQRLIGKRALFPFAFHCTGMPIKACADKLKREIEIYGNPPTFPVIQEEPKVEVPKEKPEKQKKGGKSAKAKVAQKSGTAKHQWEIMVSSDVPTHEIPKLADAHYWLKYFPPLAQSDLRDMGTKVDWRRQFITTDANPYYDAFVRWQFNKLKKEGKIKFGKRETIFSPLDNQPCMDHDRQSGEGVGVAEYILIKQEVLKPYPAVLKPLEQFPQKVFLVPATLRPETMYGQTNCWVLPDGQYGAYLINDKEIFICTARAARNLSYQENSPEPGNAKELVTFKGAQLVGAAIKAPLSKYPVIYVYPMMTISVRKTTGVVTSVPSDSPDDYAAFRDLKLKSQFRSKYGLRADQIDGFDVVPIIDIPDYGKTAAVKVVEDLKIRSQNDAEQLQVAKDLVYKEGFYEGTMLVGEFKGKKVNEIKNLIKKRLIQEGLALRYFEPKDEVISRSGDVCVVALCDQWYLDYGEPTWQKQALECLAAMDTFGDDVRNQFLKGFDWIHEWACSRSYGLGSRIPWDPVYLIESLSDSTIYMAYYTISHLLQGGVADGSVPGPANVKVDQLTDEVFDYIFGHSIDFPNTKIPKETLELCRKEFNAWYPVSLRVSGKDLVTNHLIFWIYNHVALFPKDKWPKGVKANGHLLLNGEKMSKQTGNFITLGDAVKRYSADGMRFALAEAGDSIEDPNFTTDNADNAILRLHTFIEWCKEMVNEKGTMKTGPPTTFAERVFDATINYNVTICNAAFERMLFQRAIKFGFFDMMQARDLYRQVVLANSEEKMNYDLIYKFIKTVIIICAPVISHTSEYIWRHILNEKESIFNERFPKLSPDQVDNVILAANAYLHKSLGTFRNKLTAYVRPPKKKDQVQNPPPELARVYVAEKYPEWHQQVLTMLKELYVRNNTLPEASEIASYINKSGSPLSKQINKVMPLVATIRQEVITEGVSALLLTMPFNEKDVLAENLNYLQTTLNLQKIQILSTTDQNVPEPPTHLAIGCPGKPLIFFE